MRNNRVLIALALVFFPTGKASAQYRVYPVNYNPYLYQQAVMLNYQQQMATLQMQSLIYQQNLLIVQQQNALLTQQLLYNQYINQLAIQQQNMQASFQNVNYRPPSGSPTPTKKWGDGSASRWELLCVSRTLTRKVVANDKSGCGKAV